MTQIDPKINILDKYKDDHEYTQTLMTALLDLGLPHFYKLLEKAESSGKRIYISHTKEQESLLATGGSFDGGYVYTIE